MSKLPCSRLFNSLFDLIKPSVSALRFKEGNLKVKMAKHAQKAPVVTWEWKMLVKNLNFWLNDLLCIEIGDFTC